MKIGYVRVSSADQNEARQIKAMQEDEVPEDEEDQSIMSADNRKSTEKEETNINGEE